MSQGAERQEAHGPLRADPFVREFAVYLNPYVQQTVIDIGCWEGRDTIYLSRRGHTVIGLDLEPDDLQRARGFAHAADLFDRNYFIVGDARKMPIKPGVADAVISNQMLYMLSRTDAYSALSAIQSLTKPGGLNAISTYIAKPGELKVATNRYFFAPEELEGVYKQAGWEILHYNENYVDSEIIGDKQYFSSKAEIIARNIPSLVGRLGSVAGHAAQQAELDPNLASDNYLEDLL